MYGRSLIVIAANEEFICGLIKGNTMELEAEIDPQMARWAQLNVLRSPKAEEQTSISFCNFDRKLSIWHHTRAVICLDGSRFQGFSKDASVNTRYTLPGQIATTSSSIII